MIKSRRHRSLLETSARNANDRDPKWLIHAWPNTVLAITVSQLQISLLNDCFFVDTVARLNRRFLYRIFFLWFRSFQTIKSSD